MDGNESHEDGNVEEDMAYMEWKHLIKHMGLNAC